MALSSYSCLEGGCLPTPSRAILLISISVLFNRLGIAIQLSQGKVQRLLILDNLETILDGKQAGQFPKGEGT